jgi:hypothetical protein
MSLLSKLLNVLRSPPPPKSPEEEARERYWRRMEALGRFRCCALACLHPGNPQRHFNPPEGTELAGALREHLERLWQRWLPQATGPQFNSTAVIAAGFLTYGQLEMADYILANLPPRPIAVELGWGYCNLLAVQVLGALLPLPSELRWGYAAWVEGTSEAQAVREWFQANRARLTWDAEQRRFVLSATERTT